MDKITEYTVENFRGITGPMTINLAKSSDLRAASMIIYGDNGSGKSSLVDALEFALRARLSRRVTESLKIRREVKNLSSNGAPGVLVKLTSGQIIRRGGGIAASGVPEFGRNQIVEGFQFCPLVVRRQDIESFWRIPEGERQLFFFDYLETHQVAKQREDEIKLREDLQEAIKELFLAGDYLIAMTRFSRNDLPTTYRQTRSFLQRRFCPLMV